MNIYDRLSRRERQIMDILLERREATAEEVRRRLPEAPSYSAVRAMLAKLEEKGHIGHEEEGPKYLYSPRVSRAAVRRSAVKRLISVFYNDSLSAAVTGMLEHSSNDLSDDELERLEEKIREARGRRTRGKGKGVRK